MKLFGQIVRTVVNVGLGLPAAVVKDALLAEADDHGSSHRLIHDLAAALRDVEAAAHTYRSSAQELERQLADAHAALAAIEPLLPSVADAPIGPESEWGVDVRAIKDGLTVGMVRAIRAALPPRPAPKEATV